MYEKFKELAAITSEKIANGLEKILFSNLIDADIFIDESQWTLVGRFLNSPIFDIVLTNESSLQEHLNNLERSMYWGMHQFVNTLASNRPQAYEWVTLPRIESLLKDEKLLFHCEVKLEVFRRDSVD